MRQKIIAIGGGDIRKKETLFIDQAILKASGKKEPKLLFIPTASLDDSNYIATIRTYFEQFGCIVNTLCLITDNPGQDEIQNKILSADIIYVGGGNTLRMMNLWRRLGIDLLLQQAKEQGTVLCGISAGSIYWFKVGNSDSRKFKNPAADYIKVQGLGFINALNCPHFNSERAREKSLKKMLQRYSGVAIALEDYVALQIDGQQYRIIKNKPSANAYKLYWRAGKFYKDLILATIEFKPLDFLLTKK